MQYIAFLHHDQGSAYGVTFPDLPGCLSGGDTEDQARTRAAEALAAHVQALRDHGLPVPAPSGLEAATAKNEDPAAIPFAVPLA